VDDTAPNKGGFALVAVPELVVVEGVVPKSVVVALPVAGVVVLGAVPKSPPDVPVV
jgi:hypothetical protein